MRIFCSSLAAAAALLATSGQAQASVVTYTITGALADGDDQTGIFGPIGQSLAGVAFTASFFRDDATPGATQHQEAFQSEITGYEASSPVHATLTINGITRTFGDTTGTQNQFSHTCGYGCSGQSFNLYADTLTGEYEDPPGGENGSEPRFFRTHFDILAFGGQGFSFLTSPDYHTLPALEEGDGGVALSGQFILYNSLFDSELQQNVFVESANGRFFGGSLTVDSPSAAPEPGAWALMILGFGGAGAALRRRAHAAAAAA
jgi:hypothetical protein